VLARIRCPACDHVGSVDEKHAMRRLKCSQCGRREADESRNYDDWYDHYNPAQWEQMFLLRRWQRRFDWRTGQPHAESLMA
jgi:transcription elongation factor Elf1